MQLIAIYQIVGSLIQASINPCTNHRIGVLQL